MSIDIRTIRKVIRLLKEEDIGKIKIQDTDGSVIEVSKSETLVPQTTITDTTKSTSPPPITTTTPEAPTKQIQGKHTVNSPMVGAFYISPSPDAKPFVEIGQHIEMGEVICIVEAMKMFNQIEADRAGKVTARLVENGQPVEFDQPLFVIE
jgi:acetyl-CoA carboxylase biotin carboxyl carrier protein